MEIFLVIVIGIIILIAKGVSKGKKAKTHWESAADAMDLRFHNSQGGCRTLSGVINGLQVAAKMTPSTQGNSKAPSIRYSAMLPQSLPFELRVTPQKFYTKFANRVSNKIDLETGDRHFDSKFVVEGSDPDAIREFLSRDTRNLLRSLLDRFDDLTLTESGLVVSRHESKTDDTRLIRDTTRLVKDTREIFRQPVKKTAKPSPPPLPQKKKDEPKVPVEVSVVVEEEQAVPTTVTEEHISEIEEVVPEPFKPSEPEATIELNPEPYSEPEAATPFDAEEELSSSDSILTAFKEVTGRYDFLQVFDKELKGSEYEGIPTLSSVERYSMDRILGRGPGVKATFQLGETDEGDPITLIAALHDVDELPALRSEVGNEFPICGKLTACDAFEKTVFLMTPAPEIPEPIVASAASSYSYTPYASQIGR